MHHERAVPRDREDLLAEKRFATREHEIRLLLADERLSLRRVGRRDDDLRRLGALGIHSRAAVRELALLPHAIAGGVHHGVIQTKRQHVEEAPADRHARSRAGLRFFNRPPGSRMTTVPVTVENDPSHRARPSRSSARIVVANEQSAHSVFARSAAYQQIPR